VADLNIDYELKDVLGLERLGASLAVSNLFDKRYIGIINASDYAVGGLPTYLPGAPRSVALTVSAKF
jgi:iron complex outermembrane receptor protein